MLGAFVVAFAVQILGYSNEQISWFLSLIPLVVLLRYPFLDKIRQFPRVRVLLWSRYIQLSCLIVLAILPLDWITVPLLLALAAWFVFGNEFLQNAVWMNFIAEVSSSQDRGRFLGRLRTWKQGTNMSFAIIGFFLVGSHLSRGEHQILLFIVMALLLNSIIWYSKLPINAPAETLTNFSGKGQFWYIIQNSPMMRRPMVLTFLNAVLSWPVLIIYVVGSLHLPANLLMLTVVAQMLGSIISEYGWGVLSDRFGIKLTYKVYFAGTLLLCPLLFLLPDFGHIDNGSTEWWIGTTILLSFYLLKGVLDAGHLMASSIYRAWYVDQAGGFHAINILTAANQFSTAMLTGIGGYLLVSLEGAQSDWIGGIPIDNFRVVTIAIMVLGCVTGLWISQGIRK